MRNTWNLLTCHLKDPHSHKNRWLLFCKSLRQTSLTHQTQPPTCPLSSLRLRFNHKHWNILQLHFSQTFGFLPLCNICFVPVSNMKNKYCSLSSFGWSRSSETFFSAHWTAPLFYNSPNERRPDLTSVMHFSTRGHVWFSFLLIRRNTIFDIKLPISGKFRILLMLHRRTWNPMSVQRNKRPGLRRRAAWLMRETYAPVCLTSRRRDFITKYARNSEAKHQPSGQRERVHQGDGSEEEVSPQLKRRRRRAMRIIYFVGDYLLPEWTLLRQRRRDRNTWERLLLLGIVSLHKWLDGPDG